ncbi:hypothetical protein GSI_08428 [Ganoderma sinense ZZ0214-1]|uniref:Uncharacterized protein n=1 Tax=Ganoderma sinense ZZ0214-1 TaxID=1077348 RepID=A0A2G8S6T4_9APHY|nr:hypothetical protein GSI_08428 [Ganoderma sinense ZZ0214-1]
MSDSDEYEPSQTLGGAFGEGDGQAVKRPCRSEVRQGMAERRTSRLFEPGGALDSQTSESQFIAGLEMCNAADCISHGITDAVVEDGFADGYTDGVTEGRMGYASVGVQTDAKPETAIPPCPCMLALLSAKEKIHSMQAAYAEQADELQKMRIWMLDNPSLFLDTSEESQVMMDAPWLSHESIDSEELGPRSDAIRLKRGVEDVIGEVEDGQWTKLSNLRTHEEQKGHKENVERKKRHAKQAEYSSAQAPRLPNTPSLLQPEEFQVPFFDTPLFPSSETASLSEVYATSSNPADSNERAGRISAALQNALAGHISFTAGDDSLPGGGDSEVTLEDVLSGAGLLRAVLHPDEEEDESWSCGVEDESAPSNEDLAGSRLDLNELSEQFFGGQGTRETYFPYANKGMMKTDILFSSSELRFSRAQKEAILAWGHDLGARDVPSLYKIEKFQKDALDACGNPTRRVQTTSGHVFYQNAVQHHIAMEGLVVDKKREMMACSMFERNWPEIKVAMSNQLAFARKLTFCDCPSKFGEH